MGEIFVHCHPLATYIIKTLSEYPQKVLWQVSSEALMIWLHGMTIGQLKCITSWGFLSQKFLSKPLSHQLSVWVRLSAGSLGAVAFTTVAEGLVCQETLSVMCSTCRVLVLSDHWLCHGACDSGIIHVMIGQIPTVSSHVSSSLCKPLASNSRSNSLSNGY